jgi:hypothetical protein
MCPRIDSIFSSFAGREHFGTLPSAKEMKKKMLEQMETMRPPQADSAPAA